MLILLDIRLVVVSVVVVDREGKHERLTIFNEHIEILLDRFLKNTQQVLVDSAIQVEGGQGLSVERGVDPRLSL